MPVSESDKLNQILAEHYELQALAHNDPNVHAWFAMVYAGRCTVEEALIGLVVVVAKEKRAYFKMIVDMKAKSTEPTPIVISQPPHGRSTNVPKN